MKNKVLYTVVAVLVIGLLGLYIYGKSQTQTPVVQTNSQNQNTASALDIPENANADSMANANANANANNSQPANAAANAQGQYSSEADVTGDTMVHQVSYDGTKFSPASLTVKVGDIVVFKNNSSGPFRVASDPHPTHTNYPEFDSKTPVAAGQTYEFKFTKIGSWGYHNHMNPSATGTIKVTK
jgi:plastocyanin